jgi:hypothetical protein
MPIFKPLNTKHESAFEANEKAHDHASRFILAVLRSAILNFLKFFLVLSSHKKTPVASCVGDAFNQTNFNHSIDI